MIHEVILYGAGKRCRTLCEILHWLDIHILAIVDSNANMWGEVIEGEIIQSPRIIETFQNKYICITVLNNDVVEQIRNQLQEIVTLNSIIEIKYYELLLNVYKENKTIEQIIRAHSIKYYKEQSVLFDCYQGLVLGGVELWTIDICRALLLSGERNVHIISDNGIYEVPKELTNHVISVDIKHDVRFSPKSILNLIEVIMSKLPCKVVTCTTDEVMLAAYLIKRVYPNQIEILSVVHNSCKMVYDAYMDFKECTDIYIGVSLDIRNDLMHNGIEPEKLYSMTCPFDCEENLTHIYTEDDKKPIQIGYAGRIESINSAVHSQKRIDLFVKCISILVQRNINFKIELAGDGPGKLHMEKYVYDHGLTEQIKFLGRLERSEISSFWHRQDICVNFADYEGRSISIIEAMGNGAIPIVTATSGTKEDILNGINGYRVPIGDYIAIADRIEYLANHREKLNKMGKLAHDMVYPKSLMKPHLEFWKRILFRENRIDGMT